MSLSKKKRFEVFKRDGFQCAYCGKTPPEIVLEVDHIHPKSKGGLDDINNLITACFDCNRGKRDIPLDKIPNKISDNLEILKAKEDQMKEYRKYVLKLRKIIEKDIDLIQAKFQNYFPDEKFTNSFRLSIKQFIDCLEVYDIIDYMEMACLKKDKSLDAIKYFCGICWNKIKGKSGIVHNYGKAKIYKY